MNSYPQLFQVQVVWNVAPPYAECGFEGKLFLKKETA